jgi:predicted restriction endonuclease
MSVINVARDRRLKLFDPEVNTNVKSSKLFRNKVSSAYGHRCLFCHKTENVTVAHLISNNNEQDYTVFKRPHYISDFYPDSIRNRILLCDMSQPI